MTDQKSKFRHVVSVTLAIITSIAGVILGLAWFGLWNTEDLLPQVREILNDPDESMVFMYTIIGFSSTLFLSILAYLFTLDRKRKKRPAVLMYFCFFGPGFEAGGLIAAMQGDVFLLSVPLAALAALATPLLIFPVEAVLRWFFLGPGILAMKLKKFRIASFFLKKGLLFKPSDPTLRESLGKTFHRSGRYSEARGILVPLIMAGKSSEDILRYVIEGYEKQSNWQQAAHYVEKLREKKPDDEGLVSHLIDLYIKMDQPDMALPLVEEKTDFESLDDILRLQRLHLKCGNMDMVRDLLKQAATIEDETKQKSLFEYRRVIQKRPAYEGIIRDFADLCWGLDKKDEAADSYERIIESEPENLEIRRKLLGYYLETSRLKPTERHLEFLIQKGETSPLILSEYAHVLIQKDNPEAAMEHLERAEKIYPEEYHFPYLMAQVQYDMRNLDEASKYLNRSLELVPEKKKDEIQILNRKIQGAVVNDQIKELRARIKNEPENLELRWEIIQKLMENAYLERVTSEIDSLLYYHPDTREETKKRIRELVETYERNYLLLDYLADMHLKDEDYEKCMEIYEKMASQSLNPKESLKNSCRKLLKIQEDFVPALKKLGDLAREEGDAEGMIHYYCRCLDVDREAACDRLEVLLDALYESGDLERAEEIGRFILEREPDNLDVMVRLGQILLDEAQYEDSLEYLEKARKKKSEDAKINDLIDAATSRLQKSRLENLYEKIEKEPDNSEYQEKMGDLLVFFKDYTEAVKHYQRAAQLSPQPDLCKTKLALCLAKRGMLDLASETLDEVKLQIKDNPQQEGIKEFIYKTARQFEKEMEPKKALDYYKRIFRVDAGFRDVVKRIEQIEGYSFTTTPYGKRIKTDTS